MTSLFTEKGFHPPVSALGYVVGNTGGYYAGNSRHGEKLLRVSKIVKLIGMVSLYFLPGYNEEHMLDNRGRELPGLIYYYVT